MVVADLATPHRKRRAVVLGGGHNGLICALGLADENFEVILMEAQPKTGGAASNHTLRCGCKLSRFAETVSLLDAQVLTMLQKFIDFDVASILIVPDPQMVLKTSAGTLVFRRLNLADFINDIAGQLGETSAKIGAFLTDIEAAAASVSHLWTDPFASRRTFGNALNKTNPKFGSLFLSNSLRQTMDHYFRDDTLRLAFGALSSIIAGPLSDPESAFCLLYLSSGTLSHSPDYALPQGGMGRLPELLTKAATEAGVQIELNKRVTSIRVEEDRVKYVETEGGHRTYADVCVSAISPKSTSRILDFDASNNHKGKSFIDDSAYETGCTKLNCTVDLDIALSCLVDRNVPVVKTILCNSAAAFEDAAEEVYKGRPSKFPYVEIVAPALIDRAQSCGLHIPLSLYALFFPYDWCAALGSEKAKQEITERVLAVVRHWLPTLAAGIRVEEVITPLSLEHQLGMWRGDVDHGSFARGNILETRGYARLPHGSTEVKNLFNCSSGIHPGGLVTGRPALTCLHTILREGEW